MRTSTTCTTRKKNASKRSASAGAADASTSTSAPRTFEDLLMDRRIIKGTRKTESPGELRREYVARKRAKQFERVLLPDAAPRKRSSKTSPVRSTCRLVPGTPTTPPLPMLQPWQIKQQTLTKSVASPPGTVSESEALPSGTASENVESPLMCDWTTGDLRQGDIQGPFFGPPISATSGVQIGGRVAVSPPQQNSSPTSNFSDSVTPLDKSVIRIKLEIEEPSADLHEHVQANRMSLKRERNSDRDKMYAGHKVKEEMCIGPVVLHKPGPSAKQGGHCSETDARNKYLLSSARLREPRQAAQLHGALLPDTPPGAQGLSPERQPSEFVRAAPDPEDVAELEPGDVAVPEPGAEVIILELEVQGDGMVRRTNEDSITLDGSAIELEVQGDGTVRGTNGDSITLGGDAIDKAFSKRAKKNKPAVALPSSSGQKNTRAVTTLPSSGQSQDKASLKRAKKNKPAVALPSSSRQKNTPAVIALPSSSGQSQGIDVDAGDAQDIVGNLLEEICDTENDEELLLPVADTVDFDYANEAPAFAHDQLDANEIRWLTEHDSKTDQLMKDMMTGEDQLTFEWTCDVASFLGQREEFRGHSGPTFLIDDNTKPVDVFLKYFSEVLDVIVSETNRQISSFVRPLREHSRFHRLKETDRSEMAIFTAMLILQGLCPLPVEKDFWRENGYLTLKYFKTLMAYNRFILLKSILHFSDNDASIETMTPDEVKLRKLGPLLNILNRKFSELYLPSRDIAIDESLLKWHGRLSFTQKIATKAAKVGVKSYELCESRTGYLWKFFIYTGKGQTHGQTDMVEQDEEQTVAHEQVSVNVTAQIVIDLVKPLLNRGHTLTMDNFYNSPLLARYLKSNGTDCLGTLRVNRKFVPESIKGVSKSELRPGEVVQTYCRDMSILLWRDNNLVAMISTFHKGEIGGKEKYGHYKYKPKAVLDYNLSMGGVDRKDQLLAAHPMERIRNQAWYKKVYRRLLNVTVLNAYIVYKTHFSKMTQREFRSSLANDLIAMFRKPEIEPPRDVQVLRVIRSGKRERHILSGNHFIGRGHSRNMTCVLCRKARTTYICKQCNVALCINECFERYHTE